MIDIRLKVFRITTVILVVLLMTSIFCLSAQKAGESDGLSEGFTYKVLSVVYPGFSDMTEEEQTQVMESLPFSVRKLAHFSLFGLLGLASFLSFISYKIIPFSLRCIFSFALSALYAASDEFHQTFVDGRSGEIRDVLIDSSGALLAILLAIAVVMLSKRLRAII